MSDAHPTKPSDISHERGRFDTLADRVSTLASTSWFFGGLALLVLTWAALGPVTGFTHGWVDTIQVAGTLVALLLVAVLENEQWRNSKATQRKLNALADALAHHLASDETAAEHVEELRAAVGLEKRESTSH